MGDDSFMCAGGEDNKDACKGDGGGPLACQDPTTGRYVLTGITAFGIGCGNKDVPGVYADVAAFTPWIQNILSGNQFGQQQQPGSGYQPPAHTQHNPTQPFEASYKKYSKRLTKC